MLASGVVNVYEKMSGQMRIIGYTLSDVFTLDPENRWVVIALSVIVMNLSKLAKAFLRQILKISHFTSFKVHAAAVAA